MSDARKLDTKVGVEGWSGSLRLIVTEDRILWELTDCSGDCDICRERISSLERVIRGINEHECKIRSGLFGGQTYLVIKPKEMPADPCAFLTNLLGLNITLVI